MMKLYQVAVFYLFKRFGKLNEILIKTILEWVQVLSYEFFVCVCVHLFTLCNLKFKNSFSSLPLSLFRECDFPVWYFRMDIHAVVKVNGVICMFLLAVSVFSKQFQSFEFLKRIIHLCFSEMNSEKDFLEGFFYQEPEGI